MLDEISPAAIRPLRRAEYDRLVEPGAFHDERIELLAGALMTMGPIGGPHAKVVARLTKLFVTRRGPDDVEVADSSLAVDRGVKARIYAAAGVPDYWICNIGAGVIEVHREPLGGGYSRVERVGPDAPAPRPVAFPDIEVSLTDLGC